MTTLHPDLLRACAAYLAHADAYSDSDAMELMRDDAMDALTGADLCASLLSSSLGLKKTIRACDELINVHLAAIRHHGQFARTMGGTPVGTKATALAILEATNAMLARWCEKLAR